MSDSKQLQQWFNRSSLLWKAESFWPEQPVDLIELDDDNDELKKKSFKVHLIIMVAFIVCRTNISVGRNFKPP